MTYPEALDAIHGLESRAWRHGLDRMRAFVKRAGLAPTLDGRGYIHVAGTNGKGTTTAFVESILRHQGWRTGAFFSPFVVDYRERIQADGRLIGETELASLVERLLPVANAMADTPFGGATKFELEAAMGLAYWEKKRCDWVALEVGLGGRLDATNVVAPRACVIASIGLDHTAILGHTLEAIAREKAGIIKPGVPVVIGEMPTEARDVVVETAREVGAPYLLMGRHIDVWENRHGFTVQLPGHSFWGLRPTLGGERTPHNMALALAACFMAGALRKTSEPLLEGVRSAWLPGRFDVRQIRGREAIFDGAHNEEAARALRASLGDRRLRLVTNMLAGHEAAGFYAALRDATVAAEVAPIASPRALSVPDACRLLADLGIPARAHATVAAALDAALREADGTPLVTGSNYLVGEALRTIHPEG